MGRLNGEALRRVCVAVAITAADLELEQRLARQDVAEDEAGDGAVKRAEVIEGHHGNDRGGHYVDSSLRAGLSS